MQGASQILEAYGLSEKELEFLTWRIINEQAQGNK
jgi:hypothetical protein